MAFNVSRKLLLAAFTGMLACLWSWAFFEFKVIDQTIETAKSNRIQNVARSTKAEIQSLIETSDEILSTLKFHYERESLSNEKLLDDYLKSGILKSNLFNQAGIIDKNGIYIYSNLKNQKKIDLSDREHFWIHKSKYPYQLFFSKPVLGRASNKWSIQITIKIVNKVGDFNGVAVLSIDPRVIIDYFEKYNLGDTSLIALIDNQGNIRALKANSNDFIDDSMKQLKLPDQWESKVLAKTPFKLSFDQVERYYTYERIDNSDLILLVGIKEDTSLIPFNSIQTNILLLACFVSALLLILSYYLDRLISERYFNSYKLANVKNELDRINSFYDLLINKLSNFTKTELSKIQEDTNFIENQTQEELSSVSAKSIDYHAKLLTQINENALTLQKMNSDAVRLQFHNFSIHEILDKLNSVNDHDSKSREIVYKNLIQSDQIVRIDLENTIYIVTQIVNYLIDENFVSQPVDVSCSIDSSESANLFINFQLNLLSKDIDEKLKNDIDSKFQLGDIDLHAKFHFMLAKYWLFQMKGDLTITTVSSDAQCISIRVPCSY
jgi:hypothetical protein